MSHQGSNQNDSQNEHNSGGGDPNRGYQNAPPNQNYNNYNQGGPGGYNMPPPNQGYPPNMGGRGPHGGYNPNAPPQDYGNYGMGNRGPGGPPQMGGQWGGYGNQAGGPPQNYNPQGGDSGEGSSKNSSRGGQNSGMQSNNSNGSGRRGMNRGMGGYNQGYGDPQRGGYMGRGGYQQGPPPGNQYYGQAPAPRGRGGYGGHMGGPGPGGPPPAGPGGYQQDQYYGQGPPPTRGRGGMPPSRGGMPPSRGGMPPGRGGRSRQGPGPSPGPSNTPPGPGVPPQGPPQQGPPQGGPAMGNQGQPPADLNTANLNQAQEKILKKFNTLDRGTYYLDQKNKTINFLIQGNNDIIGWHDDYLINGYLLHGLILKVDTLTSRIFLFVETEHEIYKNNIEFVNNRQLRWSNAITNEMQIISITNTEKVEVYDNFEEGFEGFICYIVTEESELASNAWPVNLQGWIELQRNLVLYEPTSIRKIYLDNLYNWLEKPESSEFNGKRIAAIINPDVPGETIKYAKRLTFALEKKCVVGSISTQYGVYTLMAEQVQDMKRFSELVEKALDIAEELGAYVMITNLRRTFDYDGKTVLYLPNDPTLKILTYDGAITFSNTSKKSLALN